MHHQPGAEQLGAIPASQLATVAGGATSASPSYRLPVPGGSYGWYLPSQPAPHAPAHPPAPHAPSPPRPPVPTCHAPAPPALPYYPMWPGNSGSGYGYGFNPWGLSRA
jgi:hypothetical protein